jgi:peptidoglycan/LPS O-acetylase OafA/YrhL
MSITSIYPYFILMAWFILLGHFLDFEEAKANPRPQGIDFSIPLESLRGILALGVFFFHSLVAYFYYKTGNLISPPSDFYLLLGSGPVTMFFFLSGYLFWSKCMAQNGIPNIRKFFIGRCRRLLPAYYVLLFALIILSLAENHFSLLESPLKVLSEIMRWVFMGMPFGQFPNLNGVSEKHLTIAAGVVWTLRFEMFFYFLLPFLGNFSRKHWTLFWLALFAVSYGCLFNLSHQSDGITNPVIALLYDLSRFYTLGFGFGMLTAYLKTVIPPQWAKHFSNRWLTVIPFYFLFIHFYKNSPAYSPRQSFRLFIPFIFIVFGNDFFGLLSRRPLVFLGKISYSIYLTHGFLLFMITQLVNHWIPFQNLEPIEFWCVVFGAGTLTLFVSTALYKWVELPWMRKKG